MINANANIESFINGIESSRFIDVKKVGDNMLIILKTLGNEYNITNLVDLVDIPQTKTLDGTLNMSNIIIPFVKKTR